MGPWGSVSRKIAQLCQRQGEIPYTHTARVVIESRRHGSKHIGALLVDHLGERGHAPLGRSRQKEDAVAEKQTAAVVTEERDAMAK